MPNRRKKGALQKTEKYARTLGVDPVTESTLMPLIRDLLRQPLPRNWRVCKTKTTIQYENGNLGKTLYYHPCKGQHYAAVLKERQLLKAPATRKSPPAGALNAGGDQAVNASKSQRLSTAPTAPQAAIDRHEQLDSINPNGLNDDQLCDSPLAKPIGITHDEDTDVCGCPPVHRASEEINGGKWEEKKTLTKASDGKGERQAKDETEERGQGCKAIEIAAECGEKKQPEHAEGDGILRKEAPGQIDITKDSIEYRSNTKVHEGLDGVERKEENAQSRKDTRDMEAAEEYGPNKEGDTELREELQEPGVTKDDVIEKITEKKAGSHTEEEKYNDAREKQEPKEEDDAEDDFVENKADSYGKEKCIDSQDELKGRDGAVDSDFMHNEVGSYDKVDYIDVQDELKEPDEDAGRDFMTQEAGYYNEDDYIDDQDEHKEQDKDADRDFVHNEAYFCYKEQDNDGQDELKEPDEDAESDSVHNEASSYYKEQDSDAQEELKEPDKDDGSYFMHNEACGYDKQDLGVQDQPEQQDENGDSDFMHTESGSDYKEQDSDAQDELGEPDKDANCNFMHYEACSYEKEDSDVQYQLREQDGDVDFIRNVASSYEKVEYIDVQGEQDEETGCDSVHDEAGSYDNTELQDQFEDPNEDAGYDFFPSEARRYHNEDIDVQDQLKAQDEDFDDYFMHNEAGSYDKEEGTDVQDRQDENPDCDFIHNEAGSNKKEESIAVQDEQDEDADCDFVHNEAGSYNDEDHGLQDQPEEQDEDIDGDFMRNEGCGNHEDGIDVRDELKNQDKHYGGDLMHNEAGGCGKESNVDVQKNSKKEEAADGGDDQHREERTGFEKKNKEEIAELGIAVSREKELGEIQAGDYDGCEDSERASECRGMGVEAEEISESQQVTGHEEDKASVNGVVKRSEKLIEKDDREVKDVRRNERAAHQAEDEADGNTDADLDDAAAKKLGRRIGEGGHNKHDRGNASAEDNDAITRPVVRSPSPASKLRLEQCSCKCHTEAGTVQVLGAAANLSLGDRLLRLEAILMNIRTMISALATTSSRTTSVIHSRLLSTPSQPPFECRSSLAFEPRESRYADMVGTQPLETYERCWQEVLQMTYGD